jgi:phosphate acetyltransferase
MMTWPLDEIAQLEQGNTFRALVRSKRVGLPDVGDNRLSNIVSLLEKEFGIECYVPTSHQLLKHKSDVVARIDAIRASKGRSPQGETKDAVDPFFHCGTLLSKGDLDAVVGGLEVPTAHVIRSALNTVGLQKGVSLISSAFLMLPQTNSTHSSPLIFTDGAVNPAPTSDQLVDIAFLGAQAWGVWMATAPKVGFLSFSTKGSAKHPKLDPIIEAAHIFASKHPHILSDGELQFDAAIVPNIAARKAPASPVAGAVNVCVFPDLNSANIAYKVAERLGGAMALGPILLGTAQPMSDLSRGATVESVVNSVLLTLALGNSRQDMA